MDYSSGVHGELAIRDLCRLHQLYVGLQAQLCVVATKSYKPLSICVYIYISPVKIDFGNGSRSNPDMLHGGVLAYPASKAVRWGAL